MVLRILLILALLAGNVVAETIRVGAAISLKEALTEISTAYTSATGETVEFTYGSSGQVMSQIKAGAEIDVFISAATKQVDDLENENLVVAESRRTVVSNTLVLIVPPDAKDAPTSFESLAGAMVNKVAAGEPKSVPAGQYAQQVFKAMGLTDSLKDKLVYGTNVRQVLAYVERGEVSAGVVYATDARQAGEKVRVVATASEGTHEPIVYPGVIVAASKKQTAASQFLDYLSTDPAKAVFKAKGFGVNETPVKE